MEVTFRHKGDRFVALLKSGPVGCKEFLLHPRLVKRTDVNCLTYIAHKGKYIENLCILGAICMHKSGTKRLKEEISRLLNQYLDIKPNATADNFRGVALEVLHIVERLAEVNVLVNDIHVTEDGLIGEHAEQPLRTFSSTANLLYYNIHICYVTDVNKVFKWFRCPTCEKNFRRSSNLQRYILKYEKLVRNI